MMSCTRFLDIVPSDLHIPGAETGSTRYEAYLHDALVQVRRVTILE